MTWQFWLAAYATYLGLEGIFLGINPNLFREGVCFLEEIEPKIFQAIATGTISAGFLHLLLVIKFLPNFWLAVAAFCLISEGMMLAFAFNGIKRLAKYETKDLKKIAMFEAGSALFILAAIRFTM
ncbi:MAG: hypothetical protein IJ566_00885 [Cardiobacteriaceae bacterium]|nr:hypothetical protein [Cardiobacteriaceae bacterium]